MDDKYMSHQVMTDDLIAIGGHIMDPINEIREQNDGVVDEFQIYCDKLLTHNEIVSLVDTENNKIEEFDKLNDIPSIEF